MDLRNKEVLVLGLGASGVAASRLLLNKGALVRCSDRSTGGVAERNAAMLRKLGCRVELGGHSEAFALGAELAVISPGVDPSIPAVKSLVLNGVPVISEIELGFGFCRCPVIAVTGTNGKTTTVTLLERIMVESGRKAAACGNIGKPFSEAVEQDTDAELVVLEVSSFQMEKIRSFKPWVALALNIGDDHLDRYPGRPEYVKAKSAVFRNQTGGDWAVVRAEDLEEWEKTGVLGRQSLGLFSATMRPGEGAYVDGGRLVVKIKGAEKEICGMDEIRSAGEQNVENIMAAALVSTIAGAPPDSIRRAVASFRGLPHRMEFVGSWRGVNYVNDSKATNPDAVLRALHSMDGRVVLIAGGKDKGFDYSVMRREVEEKVRSLILIGEASDRIRDALSGATEIFQAGSLPEAVRKATDLAAPGETVLLSPACSSYDMFRNFEERGEEFRRCVERMGSSANLDYA